MKKIFVLSLVLSWAFLVCFAGAADITVLGPKKYLRTTGTPNLYDDEFAAIAGQGKLIVKNGEADGTNRVSSAIIGINGNQILGPSDFNQTFFEKVIFLGLSGENMISIELRSAPGSYLTIEARQEIYKVAYVSQMASSADINNLVLDANLNPISDTKITNGPIYSSNPTWSRDGKKVAYRYGPHEIWTMNDDGTNKQKAITSGLMVFPSVWAIDPLFVYGNNSWAGDGEIAKFDISMGTIEMLTSVPGYNTQSFDINPNQSNIAFVRGIEGNGWTNRLYVADFISNGSDFMNIQLLPAANPAPHDPKYDPSGSKIMFVIAQPPYYTGIGIINTDNTGFWVPIPISTSGIVGTADWIDEYRIIYSYGSYYDKNLFILDLRDNSTKQVTFTPGDKFYIAVYR